MIHILQEEKQKIADLHDEIKEEISLQLNIFLDTLDQQQEIFGVQDELAKIIEKELSVSLCLRGAQIEILGDKDQDLELAADVLTSMKKILSKQMSLNSEVLYRLLDDAREGRIQETCKIIGDAVTSSFKGGAIRCKTVGQQNYIKALKENTVTICIGPAGTGKTYLAVAYAAEEFRKGNIQRIIMSRPAIEAGEERLGFLPGDLAQKVDPYLRPLYDALNDIFGGEKAARLRETGEIEIAPLAYMRGRTLSRAIVIVDESQNASLATLKMALTRLGEGSKMILTGDVTQIDLPHAEQSGLQRCAEILKGIDGIAITKLSNRDVVRNKIVRDIVKAFEKEEEAQQKKKARSTSNSFHMDKKRRPGV